MNLIKDLNEAIKYFYCLKKIFENMNKHLLFLLGIIEESKNEIKI